MSSKGHTYPRICAVCGEPFQARSPSGRYCDKPDCQAELRRIKSQRKRAAAVKRSEDGVVRDYAQEERVREAYKSFKINAPTVDAEPVRHGHWIEAKYPLFTCSECGATYQDIGYGYNYCPNCGAKMDEVTDDE